MHLSVAVLAAILVSCHASVPDISMEEPVQIGEYVAKGGMLVKILEKFRGIIKYGNATLGIPALDPLQKDHIDLKLKKEGLIELEGALDDVRAFGLSTYIVDRGDLTLVGLVANVSLTWNEIDLMTKYDITHGKLSDIEIYGSGTIAALVKGLTVSVDMKMGMKDQALFAKELVLHAHLKSLDFQISGLFNDAEMSNLVSTIISDIAPGLIDDYQNQLSKFGSPIVLELLNKILKNISISSILG